MSRILIAEDEPRIVRFLVKGLQAEGHVTTAAGDGNEALHLALSGDFDLMLLDLGCPARTGWMYSPEYGAGMRGSRSSC